MLGCITFAQANNKTIMYAAGSVHHAMIYRNANFKDTMTRVAVASQNGCAAVCRLGVCLCVSGYDVLY